MAPPLHTHQPQRLSRGDLDGEEDLLVSDIEEDLALRNQDVPAAISMRAEGGVGLTCVGGGGRGNTSLVSPEEGGASFPRQQWVLRFTLPDPPSVDVDLHWEAGVQRLMVVQDEDVAAKGVDAGGVHRCILGNGVGQKGRSRIIVHHLQKKGFQIESRERGRKEGGREEKEQE